MNGPVLRAGNKRIREAEDDNDDAGHPTSLMDLPDELLRRVGYHLTTDNDTQNCLVVIRDQPYVIEDIIKRPNPIVAYVSTCQRVRRVVQPDSLAWTLIIDESLPPKKLILTVPERLRPRIR